MPDIRASLCYLAQLPSYEKERPYKIIPAANAVYEQALSNVVPSWEENIPIEDVRARKADLKIERDGFEVLAHTSRYPILDDVATCTSYKNETRDLLAKHFMAEKVICFDMIHRMHTKFEKGVTFDYNDPTSREGPAVMAHCDHTLDSGLTLINSNLTEDDKRKYLNGDYRLRLFNTWRSLLPVVEDQPLALCQLSSTKPKDLVECDRILVDKLGSVYLLQYHPDQRWCWLENQTSSEPFVFVTWDSEASGQARYCPNLSFVNERKRPSAPPRDSVETRSIVITRK